MRQRYIDTGKALFTLVLGEVSLHKIWTLSSEVQFDENLYVIEPFRETKIQIKWGLI